MVWIFQKENMHPKRAQTWIKLLKENVIEKILRNHRKDPGPGKPEKNQHALNIHLLHVNKMVTK